MAYESTFQERLVWTLASAAALAVATVLVERLMAAAWVRTTGREPPKRIGLVGTLGEKAGKGAFDSALGRLGLH